MIKSILLISLFSNYIYAQSLSVTPKNIAPIGNVSTGNTVAGKCNGLSKDYLKITLQPSCYGANLRGGGNVLDPNKGNVIMDLTLTNSGQKFNTQIEFPNKITWPENYGQTCTWDNNPAGGKVDCDMNGFIHVSYSCKYVLGASKYGVQWFLDDYLDCNRSGDPNSDGSLNQNIKCGFLYTWSGTGYAAVNSYKRVANVANCGLQDKNINLADQLKITNSVAAMSMEKYAKRGKITVDMNGLPIKKLDVVKNSATGEFQYSGQHSTITTQFYQLQDGAKFPLTQKVEASFDEFEECLDIKASFVGQNQFCGSFYSPLILFFDNARPVFAGRSFFPLIDGEKMVAWPEKNAPGYFLALDKKHNKKITSRKQLFGDGDGFANGFEALRALDSNKDGVINNKDASFKDLVLWQDKNGDGVSDDSEIKTLDSMGVVEISLSYKDDRRKSFNRNAEGRQYSTFKMKDNKVGEIVDVWLAPMSPDQNKNKK